MRRLHDVLVITSLVVLAAHLLRAGVPLAALLAGLALAIVALFARRRWTNRLLEGVLLVGAVEWIRTAIALAVHRADLGEPYLRLLVILGAVALVTLFSAVGFRLHSAR